MPRSWSGRVRWPSWPSKLVRPCSPRLRRFDSYAAPSRTHSAAAMRNVGSVRGSGFEPRDEGLTGEPWTRSPPPLRANGRRIRVAHLGDASLRETERGARRAVRPAAASGDTAPARAGSGVGPLPAARSRTAPEMPNLGSPKARGLDKLGCSRSRYGCQAGTTTAAVSSSPLSSAFSIRRAISSIVAVSSWMRSTACSGFQAAM